MEYPQKTEPQANPYWKRNLDGFKNMLKAYCFYEKTSVGGCEYKICDYDPITTMQKGEFPKFVGFYWEESKGKMGRNLSLHQAPNEFDPELGAIFKHLYNLGLIGKRAESGNLPLDPFAAFK